MDTIKEFIFTASPWGKSDPGWMVFATSPGFDTGLVGKCTHWFRYGRPEGMPGDPPEEELGKYPVQYVVARPFGDQRVLVSQTTFTGRRWYDPRPGDWFAHGLVLPGAEGSGRSPFAWYRSPSLLARYQEEWKEKAKAIREKKIPWEDPPALPEPGSMEEVETNWEYSWESVLDRVPEGAWGKIGALLGECAKRGAGAKALVFDARMAESLDTMAALLELLPARMRWEVQFATYFHADNVRETKADGTFLFYGTVREGDAADADTGLYGAVPVGGAAFAGRRDAEVFKRMVDACGEKLGAGDWEALVACWEVATGRIEGPGKLREAVKAARRFEGLETEVAEGLAGAFEERGVGDDAGRAVALAAWFELGMGAFGDVAKEICAECAGNREAFGRALEALEGDGSKEAFLDEVHAQAERNGALPGLAAMWLGCGDDVKRRVPQGGNDRAFGRFRALAERFDGIRGNVAQGMVSGAAAAGMLAETDAAAEVLGEDFEGMEETRKGLKYLAALEKVKGLADLRAFAREAESLGVDGKTIRADALKKVPLGWIPGDKLKAAVEAYGAVGVASGELIAKVPDDRLLEPGLLDALVGIGAGRDEIIRRGVAAAEKAAETRGYEGGVREARRQAEEAARERERGRVWAAVRTGLIGAGLMAVCFAAGYGLRWWTERDGGDAVEEPAAEAGDEAGGGRAAVMEGTAEGGAEAAAGRAAGSVVPEAGGAVPSRGAPVPERVPKGGVPSLALARTEGVPPTEAVEGLEAVPPPVQPPVPERTPEVGGATPGRPEGSTPPAEGKEWFSRKAESGPRPAAAVPQKAPPTAVEGRVDGKVEREVRPSAPEGGRKGWEDGSVRGRMPVVPPGRPESGAGIRSKGGNPVAGPGAAAGKSHADGIPSPVPPPVPEATGAAADEGVVPAVVGDIVPEEEPDDEREVGMDSDRRGEEAMDIEFEKGNGK